MCRYEWVKEGGESGVGSGRQEYIDILDGGTVDLSGVCPYGAHC